MERSLSSLAALFLFILHTFVACGPSSDTNMEALREAKSALQEQNAEIEKYQREIDKLEEAVRALNAKTENGEASKEKLKTLENDKQSLKQAIKNYQAALERKDKQFREYRARALAEKKVSEVREEKQKLAQDNAFIATKIEKLREQAAFENVIDDLTEIIDKIPYLNKFDCYYHDQKDLRKNDPNYSPKLLLIEEGGSYRLKDVGRIYVDIDLNFFKLENLEQDRANLTICLHEKGNASPLFCQDEIFDGESKRIEWTQDPSALGNQEYYFIVRHGDKVLTENYSFSFKK